MEKMNSAPGIDEEMSRHVPTTEIIRCGRVVRDIFSTLHAVHEVSRSY